jgi:hypothetical protein
MTSRPEIALTQLALWYDPARIQTWPAFLASVPEDAVAGSPTDLGRRFASQRMTSTRHSSAFNLVRNLPGLERGGGRLQLRGVGYLERTPKGYCVSRHGRELASRYLEEPSATGWVLALADRLLGHEPRTRALVGLLSAAGAEFHFEGDGWFAGCYANAAVVSPGQPTTYPLDSSGDRPNLGAAVAERAWWCLGDWRLDSLLTEASDCRLVGLRSDAPSLHDIALALRAAFEVLLAAGLVKARGGVAWLDPRAAADALPGRALDFGWTTTGPEDLVDALDAMLPNLRSPTGHVVASELREALQRRGHVDPDRALAEAEAAGVVLVYAEDYGQSRHGRGLYGDPRKQLVKLRIVGRGSHP